MSAEDAALETPRVEINSLRERGDMDRVNSSNAKACQRRKLNMSASSPGHVEERCGNARTKLGPSAREDERANLTSASAAAQDERSRLVKIALHAPVTAHC